MLSEGLLDERPRFDVRVMQPSPRSSARSRSPEPCVEAPFDERAFHTDREHPTVSTNCEGALTSAGYLELAHGFLCECLTRGTFALG